MRKICPADDKCSQAVLNCYDWNGDPFIKYVFLRMHLNGEHQPELNEPRFSSQAFFVLLKRREMSIKLLIQPFKDYQQS